MLPQSPVILSSDAFYYQLSVIYRPSNLRIKVDASVVRVCASRNTASVSRHPCRAAAHAPVLTAITQ